MKKVALALLLCLLLAGCHTPAEQEFSEEESVASSQSAVEFSTESVKFFCSTKFCDNFFFYIFF